MFETAFQRVAALRAEALALADELEGLAVWLRNLAGGGAPATWPEPTELDGELDEELPEELDDDHADVDEPESLELLRVAVKNLGTQRAVAEALGVGKSAVSHWLRGERPFPAGRLEALRSLAQARPPPVRRALRGGRPGGSSVREGAPRAG